MRSRRKGIMVLVAAAALLAGSCREKVVLTDIAESEFDSGRGVMAAATLIDDPEAIKSLFKCYPPDSGVVPVYVTVKNVCDRPLQIHDLGYLPLNDTFRGFTLKLGEHTLDPIHPLEAVMYIKGKAEIPNYRDWNAGHVVSGIIVWPLGIYYVVRGVQYSRDMAPLMEHSFFPAGRGGNFDPVILKPGEKASGFIYFALREEDNPYYRDEAGAGEAGKGDAEPPLRVRSDPGLRITVNPAVSPPSYGDCTVPVDSMLTISSIIKIRPEKGTASDGSFFALKVDRDRDDKLDLVAGTAADLPVDGAAWEFPVLAELPGRKAELADASMRGGLAACAVNSKQSSRLFLVEMRAGAPAVLREEKLDRKIMSVIAAGDAIYVTTDNGFCRTFAYEDAGEKRYLNMGNDVSSIVKREDRLITFGKKEAREYLIRPGHNPEMLRRVPLSPAEKHRAGLTGDGIVVKHEGRRTHGDTLVLYDPESLEEAARQAFPGRITVIDISGDGVIVQMKGGLIMRIGRRGGGYEIFEAGWVPELAASSGGFGEKVVLASRDKKLYAFDLGSIVPASLVEGGAVTVPAGVGTPYGAVEKEEKKGRRKR